MNLPVPSLTAFSLSHTVSCPAHLFTDTCPPVAHSPLHTHTHTCLSSLSYPSTSTSRQDPEGDRDTPVRTGPSANTSRAAAVHQAHVHTPPRSLSSCSQRGASPEAEAQFTLGWHQNTLVYLWGGVPQQTWGSDRPAPRPPPDPASRTCLFPGSHTRAQSLGFLLSRVTSESGSLTFQGQRLPEAVKRGSGRAGQGEEGRSPCPCRLCC